MKRLGVGVRVKVISVDGPESGYYLGAQGVVFRATIHDSKHDWVVDFNRPINRHILQGFPSTVTVSQGVFATGQLEVLTDPKIEEQAREFVKRVTKPEPVLPRIVHTEKETRHVD